MNKQQLVNDTAAETGVARSDVWMIVETMLARIAQTIAQGEEVKLNRFGVFYRGGRKAASGRHPRTGELMNIEAVVRPKFRAGPVLRKGLNRNADVSA